MKTTRPIFKHDSNLTLRTPRLLLRPCRIKDLEAYHRMRSDPITMHKSFVGLPDASSEKSLEILKPFLPPESLQKFSFSVFLVLTDAQRVSDIQGEFTEGDHGEHLRYIGHVFIHKPELPEMGYILVRDVWGQGYATEAMRAVLDAYWKLERRTVEVEDDWPELKPYQSVDADGCVREGVRASIEAENYGSRRVAEKAGFKLVEGKERIPEPDHRGAVRFVWHYIEKPSP